MDTKRSSNSFTTRLGHIAPLRYGGGGNAERGRDFRDHAPALLDFVPCHAIRLARLSGGRKKN